MAIGCKVMAILWL